ncbi:MAG: DUF222 domain-containing protein [Acidimicrobiales bacterium]
MRSLDEVAATLSAAVDEAAEVALSPYPPGEVVGFVAGLYRAHAALGGVLTRALATADALGTAGDVGHRSLPAAIAAAGNADARTVGRDLTVGQWLRDYPAFDDAFTDGRLTRRHVDSLRDADNPRTRAHLRDGQAHLVEAAAACCFRDFGRILAEWLMRADPDGAEPVEKHRQRRCSVTKRPDGTVTGSFDLDPIAGEAVANAIEREYQRLLAEDRASTDPDRITRTATQRRADALVNLIQRGVARTDASVPAPLIHLVLGHDVATELLTRQSGQTVATDYTNPNRRCELADGTPVHPTVAAGLLGVAVLRRLVLSADSEIFDLGRAVRSFPRKLREALIAATGGRCQHPGCDAKIAWLQTDHVIPWANDGTTTLGNAQILCGYHNKLKGGR